jgi:ABC-type Mn2+/Zn2+ transport system ATPase subunit
MPRRIESITMESFKGATRNTPIEFDSGKPVVLVFGENGTGKSTIIDGIDFVCNESFGSLNDRSVYGSKADLVASIGNSPNALKVSLKYGGNVWKSVIGHGKKPTRSGSGPSPSVVASNKECPLFDTEIG